MFVEYIEINRKPSLLIRTRDENKKRITKIINDFEPYFYVPASDINIALTLIQAREIKRVEDVPIKTIEGEKVIKIICYLPQHVPKLRINFSKTFEADVRFVTRYLIDKFDGEMPYAPLRICYFDIETASPRVVPNPEDAPDAIISIACYDSFLEKKYVFVWREDQKQRITREDLNILWFNDERSLLNTFIKFVKDTDPDILTGWNVGGFDIPYLVNRLKKVGIEPKRLSTLGRVYTQQKKNEKEVKIGGRIIFDMLRGYRKMSRNELPSYKLDNIGEVELGERKVKFDGTIYELWRNDIDKLIEYNMKDVMLCVGIDKKKKMISYFDELRRITKCSFNDVFWNSKGVDCYVLSYCYGKMILPTKQYGLEHQAFKGATVMETRPGLHKNVIVTDLESLYPNIIIGGNMSPETQVDKDFLNAVDIGNGNYYRQDEQGFFPKMLLDLRQKRTDIEIERDKHKATTEEYKRLDLKSYTYKVFMNSFYGVLGYANFRLRTPSIASSTTKIGRDTVDLHIKILKENGYDPIYADTDSVFVCCNATELDDVIKEGYKIEKILNEAYPEFAKKYNMKINRFKIKFEKLYEKLFFRDAKKRYAGLINWYKGKKVRKVSIVGFESIKANNSNLGREVQRNVLEMILSGESKTDVFSYLNSVKKLIKEGKYNIEDIGISTPLRKNINEYKSRTPTVRAVNYSNGVLHLHLKRGTRFYIIYVKYVPTREKTDVIAVESSSDLAAGTIINYEKHIREIINQKVDKIFESLGWSMQELEGQKSLMEF